MANLLLWAFGVKLVIDRVPWYNIGTYDSIHHRKILWRFTSAAWRPIRPAIGMPGWAITGAERFRAYLSVLLRQ